MKRLFLFFLLFCLFPKIVFSQDKTTDQYYSEFVTNYRVYQGLIEPFDTQKSRYLAYQSVSSQADFLDASKRLIAAEIEAIASYTSFIRTYLAEATRIINYRENYLYVVLDEELDYLAVAKKKALSLSSLSESQSLLKELSSHFQKISQAGYQIKAIVELGSANKTLENIKVETDKLEVVLSEIKEEQAQIFAAKEKFFNLKKELEASENLLQQADRALKNTPQGGNFPPVSAQVKQLINQSLDKFNLIITGYKNIIFSLR